jgi:hypothetical protein
MGPAGSTGAFLPRDEADEQLRTDRRDVPGVAEVLQSPAVGAGQVHVDIEGGGRAMIEAHRIDADRGDVPTIDQPVDGLDVESGKWYPPLASVPR